MVCEHPAVVAKILKYYNFTVYQLSWISHEHCKLLLTNKAQNVISRIKLLIQTKQKQIDARQAKLDETKKKENLKKLKNLKKQIQMKIIHLIHQAMMLKY